VTNKKFGDKSGAKKQRSKEGKKYKKKGRE
jgi:hypothetical protein